MTALVLAREAAALALRIVERVAGRVASRLEGRRRIPVRESGWRL